MTDPDSPVPAPGEGQGPATLPRTLARMPAVTDPDEQTDVGDVVDAVNAVLRRFLPAPAVGAPWPADHVLGACMLAARLHRRKHSTGGVEAFGADGAVYVRRNDPDVAMLLGLGDYASPMVG